MPADVDWLRAQRLQAGERLLVVLVRATPRLLPNQEVEWEADMSLRADERTDQFERGYQAALREATEQIKALSTEDALSEWICVRRADVLAVLEGLRG